MTLDNRALLDELLRDGCIRMAQGAVLKEQPRTLAEDFSFDRIEGMLLGLAIGDALGATSESMLPAERRRRHGEVRDYLPHHRVEGQRIGLPTDDTQMAFWTLECLLADDGLVPENLATRFTQERIYGIGRTVTEFLRRYKDQGVPWTEAGVHSAGNGALMRIAPVLVPHLRTPSPALWADAALAGMLTHNDGASNATCVAYVRLLWELLCRRDTPPRGWWLETFCEAASQLEGDTHHRPRIPGKESSYNGPLWRFTKEQVGAALDAGESVLDAGDRWYSGAYLLETVPTVIHILELHGDNSEEAIVRAVNDTRDNDTVAAIVGAAVGALHGKATLPHRWLDALPGRTRPDDDGHVYDLIAQARAQFGP